MEGLNQNDVNSYWDIVVGIRMKRMEDKCELRLDSIEYGKEGELCVRLDYRPFTSYIAQESG